MKNLIFLDIDGTILDGSRGMPNISDKTRYAIKQLQQNGDHVLIASGRCKGLLYKQVYDLKPDGLFCAMAPLVSFRERRSTVTVSKKKL